MTRAHRGGSFAPPLTDETLAAYKSLAVSEAASLEVQEAMLRLHACVAQWWKLPESTGPAKPHPSGRGEIVKLDKPLQEALFDAIPWTRELDSMGQLFETIDAVKQPGLRNAAFHLLWFVKELDLDREPITLDKLG